MQQDMTTTGKTISTAIAATPLTLRRGQSLWVQLQRGTVIHASAGMAQVSRTVWLDNAMLAVQAPLHAGGVYVVPTSGWFELAALSDGVLLQQRNPAPVWGRWGVWLRLWLRSLRPRPQQLQQL
jgi:hypothetical protein